MKQLLLFMFMNALPLMGMMRDIDLSKGKAPFLPYKIPELVIPPLPLSLDELIPKDKFLVSSLKFYHDGNKKHLERLEDLWLYELQKASDNRDDLMVVTLSKRLHALGTMLSCLQDAELRGALIPDPLLDKSTKPEQSLPAQDIIKRGRQLVGEHKVQHSDIKKPIRRLKLVKDNSVKEGYYLQFQGVECVVANGYLNYLDIGGGVKDALGNWHIRGFDGRLYRLRNNEWVAWDKGNVRVYKDNQLLLVAKGASITINGEQFVNSNGVLVAVAKRPSASPVKTQEPPLSNIYTEQQQVPDSIPQSHIIYDLKLTTPTDIDELFKQRVTANPEIDFKEYLSQTGQLLHELGSKGLYTADQLAGLTKEVGQGIAKHLAHVVQHPVEYAQEFATATLDIAKEAVRFVVILGSAPEGPYATQDAVQQYIQLVDQKMNTMTAAFDQLCVTVPQMSRSEWADLLSKIIVDGLVTHNVGKGVSFVKNAKLPASILENELLSKINTSLERSLAQQVEMVTTEGIAFKASQTMEDANLLQNAAEKTIGTGAIIKVANMKNVFELNDFGRALEQNTVKTKFQCKKTGAPVYQVIEKLPEYGLKKGDQLCLDTLHFDHIEVYNKRDEVSTVLNLDGSVNSIKETKAVNQARVLYKK